TRWVLKHKRIVVVSWIVLTVAGIGAAGPASNALRQEFSVPGKDGWKTNVAIQRAYAGTGGNAAPLVPVVTLPAGKTVDSPGVRVPFLRSVGYGGMRIPLVSTLVAIPLLPVIRAKAGNRLDWPHVRTDDRASRVWTRWAQAVARRRWLAAGAGVAVILALVV